MAQRTHPPELADIDVRTLKDLKPLDRLEQPPWLDRDGMSRHRSNQRVAVRRTLEHRGRRIEIRTTYEIFVEGRAFTTSLQLNNLGRVFSSALPYEDFPSTIDLVTRLIDLYPDRFPLRGHGGAGEIGP